MLAVGADQVQRRGVRADRPSRRAAARAARTVVAVLAAPHGLMPVTGVDEVPAARTVPRACDPDGGSPARARPRSRRAPPARPRPTSRSAIRAGRRGPTARAARPAAAARPETRCRASDRRATGHAARTGRPSRGAADRGGHRDQPGRSRPHAAADAPPPAGRRLSRPGSSAGVNTSPREHGLQRVGRRDRQAHRAVEQNKRDVLDVRRDPCPKRSAEPQSRVVVDRRLPRRAARAARRFGTGLLAQAVADAGATSSAPHRIEVRVQCGDAWLSSSRASTAGSSRSTPIGSDVRSCRVTLGEIEQLPHELCSG